MAERLELNGPAFTSRAVSFMNLMRTPAFQKAFAKDPAGTAMREFQLKLSTRVISSSNEALASVLKNRSFSKWAEQFQAQIEARHPALIAAKSVSEIAKSSRAATVEIQEQFAEGVAAHLPARLVSKLKARKGWKGQIAAEDDIAILLLVFVAVVVVVVAPKARDDLLSRNTVRLLVNQLELLKNGP
jgi:hypothetical protein